MTSLVASEAQIQGHWTSAKEREAMGDVHGCVGALKKAREPKVIDLWQTTEEILGLTFSMISFIRNGHSRQIHRDRK